MKKFFAMFVILIMFTGAPINTKHSMDIPTRKGEYTTAWNESREWLEWMAKFEIVHAGSIEDPLSPESISYLRQHGVKKIMADDWMPASYYYIEGNNTPFMNWVYRNRYNVTLNPDGPFPHCERNNYSWMHEYYFDFAVPELIRHRVDYIVKELKRNGYDAIFFDWGNGIFLNEKGYESINATYHRRHPYIPYSKAASEFLVELRKKMPEIVIENNQGYREASYYLPVLDYDMAESYITGCNYYGRKLYIEGLGLTEVPDTVYYPVSIDEFNGSLNDTMQYLNHLMQLKEKYGGENFKSIVYMNYAAPDFIYTGRRENGYKVYKPTMPKNAIYFGYAFAKLMDEISYTEVPWNHEYERCNVYFYDIGKALGNYEKISNGYIRYYTNGIVVVGEWQNEKDLHLKSNYIPAHTRVYDTFENQWLTTQENEITLHIKPRLDSLTGRMAPAGRIYVYEKNNIYATIIKPAKGVLYIMDREIMQVRGDSIAIGKITIEVNATNADEVEFYIDGMLKFNDTIPPYSWIWSEFAIGKHEIMIKACGNGTVEDKRDIWILNV